MEGLFPHNKLMYFSSNVFVQTSSKLVMIGFILCLGMTGYKAVQRIVNYHIIHVFAGLVLYNKSEGRHVKIQSCYNLITSDWWQIVNQRLCEMEKVISLL